MPEVSLDFGSVGAIPEGWFRVVCDKPVYKLNNAKDGHIIEMQMHCIDMPDGFENFENFSVRDWPSLKPSARWKLQEVLSAFTGEDWSEDDMKLEVACVEDCEISHENFDKCPHEKIVPILKDATAVALLVAKTREGRTNANPTTYLVDDGSVEFGENITE
jgi:hypothetical protein